MRIPSDDSMNETLAAEVSGLRGSMAVAACRAALPDRFDAQPHGERPAFVITDRETGRTATVGLYAYGAVRETLAALFGGTEGEPL